MKEVNKQDHCNSKFGSQENMKVPIWKIIGFQQRDEQDSRNLNNKKMNNDSFCRLVVTTAQCIIDTEKHLDIGIILNYDDDDYTQGYSKIKEKFGALT